MTEAGGGAITRSVKTPRLRAAVGLEVVVLDRATSQQSGRPRTERGSSGGASRALLPVSSSSDRRHDGRVDRPGSPAAAASKAGPPPGI
mgnify:CR=1 FL=1